jgi:hypothetical protein
VPLLQLAVAQQLLQQPPYSMRWLGSSSSRSKQVGALPDSAAAVCRAGSLGSPAR